MMNEENLVKKYSVRTDLACDKGFNKKICEEKTVESSGIIINKYKEENGNEVNYYYNLDTRAIKTHDTDDLNNCINVLSNVIKELKEKMNIKDNGKCLVVGLGNINVTPDSLGPLVCDNVIVTRHMFVTDGYVSEGINEVSAIAPGVMGTTGIETYDIIEAVLKKIDIDFIIVVDALASRSINRVNKTIQVTNAGISPGSGVGNKRKELSYKTIKKPVIAIGVATVVDAVTIANDAIDLIINYFDKLEIDKNVFGDIFKLSDIDKRSLIDEVLTESGFNMILTSKEVDLEINDLTHIISGAIDKALHPLVN